MARLVQTRGRGAARNKATAAGHPAAAEGGKGEQCPEEVTVNETVSRRVSRRGQVSQTVAVEIKVEEDVKVTQRTRPTRTASQVLKGKYVAESDSEEEAQEASVADWDDEDFKEDDAMSVLSEVEVRSSPTPLNIKFEEAKEEEDLYGESVSTSPARPAAKRRRLTKASATPVSVKSAASAVFSPADSLDTPATSVSGSVRKIGSAIRGAKRKLLEQVAALSGDSDEESEFELSLESDAAEDEAEDETLSLAPTVSSEEQLVEAVSNANRRRQAPPQRRGKNTAPRLSQWEKTNLALINFHPELACIWDELETAPTIQPVAVPQPDGLSLQLLPFQLEGLDWLMKQEQQERFSGGILADEMGMGKTIQTIALLLAEPRGKPNLVIAPTVALMQWKQEIETHTNNGLSVCLYYGQNRSVTATELKNYDVVLTTYAVLESVFRKQNTGFKRVDGIHKERSLLHSIEFFRVILDEAHNIKDRSCNTARAAFALKTRRKLCLSGTPLQNRIGELFSLLRFLEADPFSYYFCKKCECKELHWRFSDKRHCDTCGHKPMDHTCWFNTELLKPIQRFGAEGEGLTAFKKMYTLLKRLMLRRTKVERADDLGLPSRVVTVRRDLFNEEEEDLYESIYGDAKRKFNTYVAQEVVLNNYANIFQLITRMRQMADHPDLVLKKHQRNGEGTFVCRICDDEAQDAIRSKCHHVFCRMCVTEYIDGSLDEHPVCPVCSVTLNIDLSAPALDVIDEDAFKRGSIVNRIDMSTWRSSTKIEALVEELWKLRSRDCTIKSIVFSQFTSFLDLIQWRIRRAGFTCVKLDGHMTPAARAATIKRFSEDPEITVFLVSLKAGGVALNLTEASQVFIMDPWYNPAVEWQSGDRVHRIGQTRPVRITRLVIENSIESRIVELQAKKAQMINATIDYDDSALSQLTPSDLEFLFSS